MMKKAPLRARLRYQFDNIMARGTIPLIIMLLSITLVVVLAIGVLSWVVNRNVFGSLGNSIWQNLMHALDAGALAGLQAESGPLFLALMTITTVCGIFITSMLIGIINSGLENKFENLRKGNSKVIEADHTVILGFDNRIFTMLAELVIANENRTRPRIVILGTEDKEVMDQSVRDYLPDHKNTGIICRTGDTADSVALERCSVEACRSIIVNEANDAKTIRTILSVTNYLKAYPENQAHITAVIHEESNVDVAKIAGEGRVEVVFFADAMSRIIAHTCRQPGLSLVYSELFSYEGNEIYTEAIPTFAGKTFGQVLALPENACVIGLKRNKQALINPPMDTLIDSADEIILIAEDDGIAQVETVEPGRETLFAKEAGSWGEQPDSLLVLGHNGLLTGMVEELDRYVAPGSRVTVACDSQAAILETEGLRDRLRTMSLRTVLCDRCERKVLENFVSEGYRNIVVLSDAQADPEVADATTLMVLMHLRDIAKKTKAEFSVTSEMLDVRNQELAKITKVNDFVVSSNLTSLLTVQISENRLLAAVFADLLDEEGSEIYLKPAYNYVVTGSPVNFRTITQAAARKGEIFIGYKDMERTGEGIKTTVRLNPPKRETITFDSEDMIIVIAED
ncbi:MAG: hypothetical protein VB049_11960 [Candidatus Pelethousia sp.]|nr:hypothetical protein [Candidatus Pelethousia sp.]